MRRERSVKTRILVVFAVFLFTFSLFSLPCFANEKEGADSPSADSYLKEFDSLYESLPEEIRDILPELTEEYYQSPEKLADLFSVEYMMELSVDFLRTALVSALKTFTFVASITLITVLLSLIGGALSSSGTGVHIWSLAGSLSIGYCTYSLVWSHLDSVLEFSKNISSFIKSLSVIIGGVYLSAGEVGSAGVNSVWAFSLTSVAEELCGNILVPIMQISFAATLCSSIMSGVNISRLIQMIRNTFTSLLIFIMTVISVILAFQTVVAHSSDTLTMRTVRYTVSHSVPIIGGLVSDSARTLATGFSLMKNSLGFVGVAVILILSLYPLISLVASKFALQLAASFSSIISEDKSIVFLDESVKMLNFLIAVVILLDVAFMFCVSVFALLPSAAA